MENHKPKTKIDIISNGLNDQPFEASLPARKGIDGLMIFGLFFAGIPMIMAFFIISMMLKGSNESNPIGAILGLVAFFTIFIAIGTTIFYFGLKPRRTSFLIRIQHGAVTLTKTVFKKESTLNIQSGNVFDVGLYSNMSKNNRPIYNLIIKARDDEDHDIKLSGSYKENELRWFASEMLKALTDQNALPTNEEIDEYYLTAAAENVEIDPDGTQHFKKAGASFTSLRDNGLSIEKNGTTVAKPMIFGGLFGIVFSAVFICIGFFTEDAPIVFGIVGIVIAVLFSVIFILGLLKLGTSEKFTFLSNTITHEKFRRGVSKKKQTFQKSDFRKLEVINTGSSNEQARYSVNLIGGTNNKLKLFKWVADDVSTIAKHQVNKWLETTPPSQATPVAPSSAESTTFGGYGSSMTTLASQEQQQDLSSLAPAPNPAPTPDEITIYNSNNSFADIKGGIWFIRLFFSLFLAVGITCMVIGVTQYFTAKDSTSWPTTQGNITKSKIETDHSGDGGPTYKPDIEYKYIIDETVYHGDKVTISEVNSSNHSKAERIKKRYKKRKQVTVYYNPEDPEESVLEPGIKGSNWFLPLFGLAFFLIPGIMFVIVEKQYRKALKKKADKKKQASHQTTTINDIQTKYGKVK